MLDGDVQAAAAAFDSLASGALARDTGPEERRAAALRAGFCFEAIGNLRLAAVAYERVLDLGGEPDEIHDLALLRRRALSAAVPLAPDDGAVRGLGAPSPVDAARLEELLAEEEALLDAMAARQVAVTAWVERSRGEADAAAAVVRELSARGVFVSFAAESGAGQSLRADARAATLVPGVAAASSNPPADAAELEFLRREAALGLGIDDLGRRLSALMGSRLEDRGLRAARAGDHDGALENLRFRDLLVPQASSEASLRSDVVGVIARRSIHSAPSFALELGRRIDARERRDVARQCAELRAAVSRARSQERPERSLREITDVLARRAGRFRTRFPAAVEELERRLRLRGLVLAGAHAERFDTVLRRRAAAWRELAACAEDGLDLASRRRNWSAYAPGPLAPRDRDVLRELHADLRRSAARRAAAPSPPADGAGAVQKLHWLERWFPELGAAPR